MSQSAYQRPTINTYSELSSKQLQDLAAGRLVQQTPKSVQAPQSASSVYKTLNIPPGVQASKLADKHVALQNPRGKTSELRASKQKRSETEKQKKNQAKIRGNQSRGLLPRRARRNGLAMNWETALGLHRLWLGYMAELLALDIDTRDLGGMVPTQPEQQQQPEASTSQAMEVESEEVSSSGAPEVMNEQHQSQEMRLESALDSGYSQNVLTGWHTKLSKADYHGCLISVKESSNRSLQGLTGIVVQETAGTWSIATPSDKVKVLPKPSSNFTFSLPLKNHKRLHFDVSGNQFAHRAADRVQRKYKSSVKPSFQHEAMS